MECHRNLFPLNNEIKGHGDVIVSSNVSKKVATHTFLDDHTGPRHLVLKELGS